MSIAAIVPATLSSMTDANRASMFATATRSRRFRPQLHRQILLIVGGTAAGNRQRVVIGRRCRRLEPIHAGQQARNPATVDLVAAQRLDLQLAGAVIGAFRSPDGQQFFRRR